MPKGPDFERSQFIRMQFDGNEISFRCPKHDPWDKALESHYVSKNIPLYDPRSYEKSCELGKFLGGHWFYRAISFYGPLFAGDVADLRVSVFIFRSALTGNDQTYFDPTFFETEVRCFLNERYGKSLIRGEPAWVAPVDSKIILSGDVSAIKFELSSSAYTAGKQEEILLMPIADDVMLCFSNEIGLNVGGNLDTQLETRDIKPLQELSNQILSSVSVKLSKQSKEQLAKAQAQFPNRKFSYHVAPLDWASTNQNDE